MPEQKNAVKRFQTSFARGSIVTPFDFPTLSQRKDGSEWILDCGDNDICDPYLGTATTMEKSEEYSTPFFFKASDTHSEDKKMYAFDENGDEFDLSGVIEVGDLVKFIINGVVQYRFVSEIDGYGFSITLNSALTGDLFLIKMTGGVAINGEYLNKNTTGTWYVDPTHANVEATNYAVITSDINIFGTGEGEVKVGDLVKINGQYRTIKQIIDSKNAKLDFVMNSAISVAVELYVKISGEWVDTTAKVITHADHYVYNNINYKVVTGVGTSFNSEFKVGDKLLFVKPNGDIYERYVVSIDGLTSMTLDKPITGDLSDIDTAGEAVPSFYLWHKALTITTSGKSNDCKILRWTKLDTRDGWLEVVPDNKIS